MARVLVTGAAGFIGSNLALELEGRGHDVVAMDLMRRETLREFKGEFREWDVTRPLEWAGSLDAIFHHGDITDPRYPDDKVVMERNLGGFGNLLSLADAQGARLVYASTAGLYGNGPTPMREEQEKDILTAYGESKWKMDQRAEASLVPTVGLRYFNVYGPREAHKGRAASMVYHLGLAMRDGNPPRLFQWGDQKRDFVHVKDVVAANLLAWEKGSGVFNVGSGVASTFNELVAALNKALGTTFEPDYFEMPYDSKTYQDNTHADLTRARKGLGYEPKWNLENGVRDYMDWLFPHN